ncbi:MAG: hypothetical protein ACI4EI_09745 [Muricoprocola sp.]
MKLTNQQLDQITMGIQAALGILIIGLSVKNSAQIQTAQMKKQAKKAAKADVRLIQAEYKEKQKLLKKKYKNRQAVIRNISRFTKGNKHR